MLACLQLGSTAWQPARAGESESETEEKERTGTSDEEREYQIKAAFLLNFIRYTTWPESAFEDKDSPLVLQVVGADPFGKVLDKTFEDEKAGGRKIVIRRTLHLPETVEGHLAFCGKLTDEQQESLIKACAKRPILLVGESEGFAQEGACVNFFLQSRKTRFEINIDALGEGELTMSPDVLKLARIVHTRREQ
jgi:hypothetical protein